MDHPIITALATKAHVSNIDQGSCALRMIKKKSILRSCWYLAPKELHVFSHSFKCELVWRLSWMKFVNLTSYKSWKGWCRQLVPSRVFVNSQLNNNDCLSFLYLSTMILISTTTMITKSILSSRFWVYNAPPWVWRLSLPNHLLWKLSKRSIGHLTSLTDNMLVSHP